MKTITCIFVMILFGCGNNQNPKDTHQEHQEVSRNEIVDLVINTDKLEPYIELVYNKRGLVPYIIRNDSLGLNDSLRVTKFNKRIQVIDMQEVIQDSTSYVQFEEIVYDGSEVSVLVYYPIMGMVMKAKIGYDNDWKIIESELWQY